MQCRWLTAAAGSLVLTLLPLLSGLAVELTARHIVESKAKVAPVVILQAEPFRLQDVQLLDGPFKHAMELDRKYLLSLDVNRLLHVFRLDAGLPSTAKPYGGWMAPEHVLAVNSSGFIYRPVRRCMPAQTTSRSRRRATRLWLVSLNANGRSEPVSCTPTPTPSPAGARRRCPSGTRSTKSWRA